MNRTDSLPKIVKEVNAWDLHLTAIKIPFIRVFKKKDKDWFQSLILLKARSRILLLHPVDKNLASLSILLIRTIIKCALNQESKTTWRRTKHAIFEKTERKGMTRIQKNRPIKK